MCRIVWLFNNSPRRPYGAPCSSYWCQNSVKENWLKCHSPIRFGTNSRTFSDFSDIFTSAWYPWSGRLRVRSSVFLERISFYTGWGRGEDALLGRERSGRNHVEQHGGRSGGLPAGQYILHNYLNLLHKLKESFSDSWTHHELCEDSNYDISATNSEAFRRHKRTAQM